MQKWIVFVVVSEIMEVWQRYIEKRGTWNERTKKWEFWIQTSELHLAIKNSSKVWSRHWKQKEYTETAQKLYKNEHNWKHILCLENYWQVL